MLASRPSFAGPVVDYPSSLVGKQLAIEFPQRIIFTKFYQVETSDFDLACSTTRQSLFWGKYLEEKTVELIVAR